MRYLFCTFCIASFIGVSLALAAPAEKPVYVQVRSSKLRAEPKFWAPPVAELSYGTALTALGNAPSDKSWLKAKLNDAEGFVHVSAITRRKVILSSAAQSNRSADPTEVVMAGKGFNSQVEQNYRTSKGVDFGAVDEVEQYRVDPSETAVFIRDGKLSDK